MVELFKRIIHKLRAILLLLKVILSRGLIIDLGEILSEHSVSDLVLDVAAGGSGTGPKILGGSTVALDISVDEIKEAIKNKAKAIWVCADARTMPFRDYVFNWAITFFGLMFICKKEDKERVLREILRVAKRVILVEPIIKKVQVTISLRSRSLTRVSLYIKYISVSLVKELSKHLH